MSDAPTFKAGDRDALRRRRPGSGDQDTLVIVASPIPEAVGKVLSVGREPLVIRRVGADGVEDDWMSRDHATAWREGETIRVRDGAARPGDAWKSSANGTWVGEEALEGEAASLDPGDTVRTGRTLWMLVRNPRPAPPETLLVGMSEALGRARDEIALVANQVAHRLKRKGRVSQALLVTGPRGTGKQVVAREAHRLLAAKRRPHKAPFRQVSAPSLADGTGAADLFGVVDRYATDVKARPGYFEQAHGGVLLLDEVGDTPLPEQAKLLNVLEERQVTPLGGQRAIPFDCLIVAATNKDLAALTADGGFRPDLVDRLGRFRVHLPPLDERPEDVGPLAQALLARHGFTAPLPWDVVTGLLQRAWVGNVRELDAFLERMVAVAEARGRGDIDLEMFEEAASRLDRMPPAAGPTTRPPTKRPVSSGRSQCPPHDELLARLEACDWNKSEVARHYGKHPRQVTRWMAYLGIERPD